MRKALNGLYCGTEVLFVLDDVSMLSFFPQPFRRREGEKEKGVCVGIQCGS